MPSAIIARNQLRQFVTANPSSDLAPDITTLVDAFDQPCGSCHPCTEYADETWRAAGRKPPHVYQWDEAVQLRVDLVSAVRELEKRAETAIVATDKRCYSEAHAVVAGLLKSEF